MATEMAAQTGGKGRWSPMAVIKAIFGFLGFLLMPLRWLWRLAFGKKAAPGEPVHEVVFYTFHKGVYLWFLVVVGFVGAFAVKQGMSPSFWGWVYVWVFIHTIVTLIFDVGRNKMMILAVIAFAVWAGFYILQYVKNIAVLTFIHEMFSGMNVALDPGTALAISTLLGLIWLGVLFHAFLDGRVRLTANEVEIYHFGRASETFSRIGCRFREDFRDWNETLLGLWGADMIVRNPNGHVERVFENVPTLRFKMGKIDLILETWDATVSGTVQVAANAAGAGPGGA